MTEENNNLSENARKLLGLAHKRFPNFCLTDEILFTSVADGVFADFSTGDKEKDDPANAEKWGEDRIIPADRIVWLCTDRKAKELVAYKGIQIEGAKIEGELDLLFAMVPFPLLLANCRFDKDIYLGNANVKTINLTGSFTRNIFADGLRVDDSVYLRNNFRTDGRVSLNEAVIIGTLSCNKGSFGNKGDVAINADGINVNGSASVGRNPCRRSLSRFIGRGRFRHFLR